MNITWDSVQQIVRILLQFFAGSLVSSGVITQEMSTTLVGAVLSLGGVLWWVLWERNRATS